MATDSSLNDQLKSQVYREFPNYDVIPSIAESSDFNILYFCCTEPSKPSSSWISKLIGREQQKSLYSLGWLFDYCPSREDDKVFNNIKETPVCIHSQASGSQALKGEIYADPLIASASLENEKRLDLGRVVKLSLPYKEVAHCVSRVTEQNSPELFREAKKNRLHVIYEVLQAEHLNNKSHESASAGGNVSATVQTVGIEGSGEWKRENDFRLTRPKSMGRFTFAFKCGKVRVGKIKKAKSPTGQRKQLTKRLKLVGPKKFYQPFSHQSEATISDQSQSPSQE